MFAHDVPGRGSKLRHLLRITYQEATLDWSQSLIFVITLLSNETEVITVVVLFSKRLLKCSQIKRPRDMAASSIHRCLYISVRPILRIGEYSLVALQHRRIRYIGLRVSADAE